ncbi:unnamed protein product [Closterium sp. Yama58-4]|nr:unnamed protein product [Closterium sp. Yama58-4]
MNSCRISRRRLRVQPGATSLLHVAIFRRVTFLLYLVAFVRVADGLVDCHNLTNPSESSNLLSNPSFDTSCLDTGWRRKKLNASCDPWPYLFPWRALEPGETISTDELLATAASGGAKLGPLLTSAGATLAEAIATAAGAASPADVSINNGVGGVTDTLLAADGSRFLLLTSVISASPSDDDASGSSNGSNSSSGGSAFGGPGVAQALCELKPAAAPTSNDSQQAQQAEQQQSPRQLSLSFFARASLCAEGEGEAERLLKHALHTCSMLNSHSSAQSISHCTSAPTLPVHLLPPFPPFPIPVTALQPAPPLSRPFPTGSPAPETHSFPLPFPSLPIPPAALPPIPHPCHFPAADPSPLKSFSHWPLSTAHPLLTAGSARRNRAALSLTTLSDLNSAALALHPSPFALLAPATPASPCRPFSFSTSFAFRISSPNAAGLGGEGLAFVMLPSPTLGLPGPSLGYGRVLLPPGSTTGASASEVRSSYHPSPTLGLPGPSLGYGRVLLPPWSMTGADNSSSSSGVSSQALILLSTHPSSPPHPQQQRSLAVEFDTSFSPEFFDRPDHHVGVNLHGSMLSLASAPVHPVGIPALNAGQTLLATIQYNASSSQLSVWLSPVPRSSSRSSSPVSPPLPRSAVLSMFLDTCEWLGGNDPQAAAAPPPLFVGFTAATGKGAEQVQQHEVLGWSFEVADGELLGGARGELRFPSEGG